MTNPIGIILSGYIDICHYFLFIKFNKDKDFNWKLYFELK